MEAFAAKLDISDAFRYVNDKLQSTDISINEVEFCVMWAAVQAGRIKVVEAAWKQAQELATESLANEKGLISDKGKLLADNTELVDRLGQFIKQDEERQVELEQVFRTNWRRNARSCARRVKHGMIFGCLLQSVGRSQMPN